MKKFLKILGVFLLSIYLVAAVVLTVFLLNYNKYGVTELGNYTLIKVEDDELAPDYQKGDLLVVEKVNNDLIKNGDSIFFYEKDLENKTIFINLARVLRKRKITDSETTFVIEGEYEYSSDYVIGDVNNTKVYHGVGTILSLLESRFGFLLFIILPILFIFLYELYAFVLEVKLSLKEE